MALYKIRFYRSLVGYVHIEAKDEDEARQKFDESDEPFDPDNEDYGDELRIETIELMGDEQ